MALLSLLKESGKSVSFYCGKPLHNAALLVVALILLAPNSVLAEDASASTRQAKKNEKTAQVKSSAKDSNNAHLTQLRFVIYSVSCLACVRKIERHLRQTEGVSSIDIKMGLDPVFTVDYNPKKVKEELLIEIVNKEGYRYEKLDAKPN